MNTLSEVIDMAKWQNDIVKERLNNAQTTQIQLADAIVEQVVA